MKKKLYDYQLECVKAIIQGWLDKETPYAQVDTGGGKSLICADIAARSLRQNYRVLCLVPSHELVVQNANEFIGYTGINPGVCSAKLSRFETKHPKIVFATYTSFLKRRASSGHFDVLMVDECFTKDTKVLLTKGWTNIDLVNSGDKIYNATGIGIIEKVSIKPALEIYHLELSNGTIIKCTRNHPFFTERGWVPASELVKDEIFFSCQELRNLWESVQTDKWNIRKRLEKEKYLFKRLLKDFPKKNKINGLWKEFSKFREAMQILRGNLQALDKITENKAIRKKLEQSGLLLSILCKEIKEPYVGGGKQKKGICNTDKNEAQTYQEVRERAINALTSACAFTCFRGRMGSGDHSENKCRTQKRGLSISLQDRYRESGKDDSDRDTRNESQYTKKTGRGQEKKGIFNKIRLVGIRIEQRESFEPVYNLQVSGHPSFFANGVLVHNCHYVSNDPTTSYRKIISALQRINPNLKICGLSATPYRMGSGMSHESCVKGKAVFTKQVFSTDIAKLIADGRLSHVQSLNSENSADLDGVKMKGHDYDQELASVKFDAILSPGVLETKRLFDTHQITTALIYASNIANAQRIVDEWGNANECKIAHGSMGSHERKAIVEWLKNGNGNRYIINVGLFTTGFNFERLEAVVLFIATKSLAKYKQIVGRCLRAHDDKPCAYVIDFGGNIDEHGPIDATLPPKAKKKRGEAPQKLCLLCNEINLLSAKTCKKCEALFVNENEEGRYSMKSKAQVWKEKHPPVTYVFEEPYQQIPYFSLAYSKKDGRKMIKMQFDGVDYHHYIMLDHAGWAKQKSDKFIFDLLKNKDYFYDLNYEGLTVENLLPLLETSYTEFFKPFKSITISPVEDSKYKEMSYYELE